MTMTMRFSANLCSSDLERQAKSLTFGAFHVHVLDAPKMKEFMTPSFLPFQTIAVLREAVAKKYATFFQSTLHHNNGYFAQVNIIN